MRITLSLWWGVVGIILCLGGFHACTSSSSGEDVGATATAGTTGEDAPDTKQNGETLIEPPDG
ncbi:MAG TPA: hypothetical protein EYN66_03380, partial [Myxococcales bacterium]|nr:hypothetical protein [Myxococcales bacterium]